MSLEHYRSEFSYFYSIQLPIIHTHSVFIHAFFFFFTNVGSHKVNFMKVNFMTRPIYTNIFMRYLISNWASILRKSCSDINIHKLTKQSRSVIIVIHNVLILRTFNSYTPSLICLSITIWISITFFLSWY